LLRDKSIPHLALQRAAAAGDAFADVLEGEDAILALNGIAPIGLLKPNLVDVPGWPYHLRCDVWAYLDRDPTV
jgi:hypothetical protein